MLDYKDLAKSKEMKELIAEAMKSPKGTADLMVALNNKTYVVSVTPAKK